jgi:hypothetical protein
MSFAVEILDELQRRGVIVTADDDTLCLRPRRALDNALLIRVRKAKPTILAALRSRLSACGSPHCAGCYEVEPGVRIHPPKCSEEYRAWLERWQPKGKPQ